MTAQPTRDRFIRECADAGYRVGCKVRCRQPGRYKALVENDIYTVSWVDWPFCLEVEEVPNFTWDLRRFTPWTGAVSAAELAKKPRKKASTGKGAIY